MAWYGGLAGPTTGGQSRYRVVLDMRTSTQTETQGLVQVRRYVQVTNGDFWGSHLTTSWAGVVIIRGVGTYADTGWQNVGYVNYGKTTTQSASAHYTSASGAYHNSSVSASYSPSVPTWTPNAPTSIVNTRNSDTKNTITWKNNSTTARKYAYLCIERSVDGGNWTVLSNSLSATATSYVDSTTSKNHHYRYRVRARNSAGYSSYVTSGYTYNTPNPCTGITNTRNSDTKNTITWTRGSTVSGVYSSIVIRRSVDGGAFSDLATLAATATSYADTTTSANHYYKYVVVAKNSAGSATSAESNTTYNTPAAPTSLTLARRSETGVRVTISNPAKTATALTLQRSTNGSSWTTVTTVSGSAVTMVDDNPGGGTFYYRARNERGSLVSAWTQAASPVVTICPPNAPTLNSPASSSVIKLSDDTVTFSWSHNPIDGSAQTGAQVQYSTNGGTSWTTVNVTGSAQSLTINNDFANNAVVTWRVRTKGTHADYGSYSANRTFTIHQVPTAVITSPVEEDPITNTPVLFSFDYSDTSGSLSNATLLIKRGGTTVFTKQFTNDNPYTIEASEWLPEDNTVYVFELTVRSTSTLQNVTSRQIEVHFDLPNRAFLRIMPDRKTGFVELALTQEEEGGVPIARASIYRLVGDERVLISEDALDVLTVIDRYAPLNSEYYYEAVSFADSGAARSVKYRGSVETPWAFFYYGDKFGDSIAKARLTPTGSKTFNNPNAALVYYAGRQYPVSYDDDSLEESAGFSAILHTREEATAFYQLMREDKGRCVYKSLNGEVYHAKCTISVNENITDPDLFGTIEVTINRISGEVL